MNLEFSPKSVDDLMDILEFIARDKPKAAIGFVAQIENCCRLIASFPHVGMSCENLLPKLRLFSYRGYGIYFRVVNNMVRIERVLHHAQDVQQDFFA